MGMKFKEAICATPDVSSGFCNGIQALGSNARFVKVSDTRKIEGSVDIDSCTKTLYPSASRWDYVVGYDSAAYYLEVHPASTGDVDAMCKKAMWLKNWLSAKATLLKDISKFPLYWVPSGRCKILKTSPQFRKLVKSDIKIVSILQL